MSRKARTRSVSRTTSAGISPATMRQNRQSLTVPTLGCPWTAHDRTGRSTLRRREVVAMVAPRTSSTRSRWVLSILLVVVAALLPPSAASAGDRDGGPSLTVMTRNLYLGTGLNNMLTATTPEQLVEAVTVDWAHVVATDFPTRAQALAAEVRQTRPDVIGLQEVTLWRDQLVSDAATAPG